ncbi:hypothetical protein Q5P01_002948 [Channa striata]|uniref:Uncharacterized protein n=1 Tax=Channa striata TaxID=64152 RepID=A0AA88NS02_CHASR|nr:hypothetical protein Q5P01_002948 [Channa striata]
MDMWGGMCVCEDSKLSKAEILRGLITDKLTTAAREIFAVVERTVTGYEDEVSGLKQEVDRQRRQLEAVLQPQVSLCRIDHDELSPVCGVENGDSGGAEDTADTYSLEDYEHEGDEGKEEPAQISGLGREILQEVNNHTPYSIAEGAGSGNECRTPDSSREVLTDSPTDSGSSNTKRKRLIPVNSAADSKGEANEKKLEDGDEDWRALSTGNKKRPLKLSVCFLDNWPADVLSNIVFKKCPIQELLCPHGLQEEDFLKLLRSVFPKLAADKAFDVYMTDRTRILQPLKLETLTPERIWRALRSTGAGKSSLYIRLKTAQLDLFQRNTSTDSPSTSAAVMTSDETRQHTSVVQCKQETTMHLEETEEDIGGGEEMNDRDDSWKPDVTEDMQASALKLIVQHKEGNTVLTYSSTSHGSSGKMMTKKTLESLQNQVMMFKHLVSVKSEAQSDNDIGDDKEKNDRDDERKPDVPEDEEHERKVQVSLPTESRCPRLSSPDDNGINSTAEVQSN